MNLQIILLIFFNNIAKIFANKYCSLESNGEPKYYICARNEYCCHFGCCVHLAFQFYQLWYYWLLLIFMFMICSGGSWWYKFCRQNETSNYPSTVQAAYDRCGGSGRHLTTSIADARRNRAIERSNFDNASAYYFQRLWKANGTTPPPNYYTASVVRYHSASELETRRQHQECPYYQLYGPPPSYESVIHIPENGYGTPSCTLIASPPPPSPLLQQQSSANSFANNLNAISNITNLHENSLSAIAVATQAATQGSTAAVAVASSSSASTTSQLQQKQITIEQQQNSPRPSTSMQVDHHHPEDNLSVIDDDDDDDDDENDDIGDIPSTSSMCGLKFQITQGNQQRFIIPENKLAKDSSTSLSPSQQLQSYHHLHHLHHHHRHHMKSLSTCLGKPVAGAVHHNFTNNYNHNNSNFILSSSPSSLASTSVTTPSTTYVHHRNTAASAVAATTTTAAVSVSSTATTAITTATILETTTPTTTATNTTPPPLTTVNGDRSTSAENNHFTRSYSTNFENGTQV